VTGRSCPCGERPASHEGGIRVLVVDDHPLVRSTLTELISDEADLTVVGECADGSQVVDAVERLHPDVVLMDLSMPGMNGLAATEALRAVRCESRVVVLTAEPAVRAEVEAAGANALLPKGLRSGALLGCLRTVVVGCGCCPYCL
jgi:DNA-binding NarL/FixJ family response regulator